jgi:hypothetical protein
VSWLATWLAIGGPHPLRTLRSAFPFATSHSTDGGIDEFDESSTLSFQVSHLGPQPGDLGPQQLDHRLQLRVPATSSS